MAKVRPWASVRQASLSLATERSDGWKGLRDPRRMRTTPADSSMVTCRRAFSGVSSQLQHITLVRNAHQAALMHLASFSYAALMHLASR